LIFIGETDFRLAKTPVGRGDMPVRYYRVH
jgi:hypothetical protein